MRFIPGINVWFNIQTPINLIHKSIHLYQWMQKKHLIKSFVKSQHTFMKKNSQQTRNGGTYPN